ncbi:MAG: hypothetical protein EBR62_05810 [Verrucomicrobia bacterium]|nr:hypothetical protein [Verrucomicrobiota bacterium]
MSRAVSVALLTLALCWVSLGFAQDLPPTPLNSQPVLPTAEQPRQRTLLELADEALAAGLSTTAAQLYTATLATPGLTSKERERASLGLAAGQIERTKTTEARETLKGLPDSPRKALYEGLLALLENDLPAATAAAEKADPEQLPVHESAWGHALRALIATAKGDSLGVNTHLANATRTAVSEEQRQRIEVLSFRASIIAGKVDDVTISVLRERASNAKGSPLAFAFSRNLALALARKDRRAEAVNALKEAAPLPDTRQAEADLLCGLILGYDSAEGRRFLQLAAKNPANPSVRLTALRALVAAAADAKTSDSKAIANEVYDFLMKRPEGQLSFECPRDPAVLDAIHLARAQLMLVAGNREKARQAASDLLKDVPASPLAREATRTLALTAWGDGSYRLASSFLNTLAEGKTGIPRDVLRTVSADCLFLAADYALAEKAYAAIQTETDGADLATSAFHQRVLSSLATAGDAKLWNHTAEIIESAQRNAKIPKERLWIAVWLLVEDARKANQTEEAARLLQRLNPLIARTNTDYALRFDWQRALIALANRDPSTAARLADDIARRLDDLPVDASADLKVNAPKLRGHVALLKARTALGANSGKGLADLEALRKKYGKVPATASSYLVEGRHLAALGRHAEAQARFLALAKEFAGDATLTEFAELGLYEAAEEATRQAPVDADMVMPVPESGIPAAQGFARASGIVVCTDDDKSLAELRRDRKGELDRQRVAIAAGAYENVAIAWARDPDTLAEARYKLALALLERAKAESKSDAPGTRLEAKTVLVRALASLRQNGATDETSFGPTGRTWIASSILLLGNIHEEEGDTAEAIAVYRLIPELNRGLAPGESRLPGQGAAESKLASLRANGNNQKPR